MDAEDCNRFREQYGSMSFKELQDFYNRMAKEHPVQSHYEWSAAELFFRSIGDEPYTVVEIGGWDGELADRILSQERHDNCKSWINYEIADVEPLCTHGRYLQPHLDDFPWKREISFTALVASHVLEHMYLEQVAEVIAWANRGKCEFIYTDIPQTKDHTDNTDTHVLVCTEADLLGLFSAMGWRELLEQPGKDEASKVRWFVRAK